MGYFWGNVWLKKILVSSQVVEQLLFSLFSSILTFYSVLIFGSFLVWGPMVIFGVRVGFKTVLGSNPVVEKVLFSLSLQF